MADGRTSYIAVSCYDHMADVACADAASRPGDLHFDLFDLLLATLVQVRFGNHFKYSEYHAFVFEKINWRWCCHNTQPLSHIRSTLSDGVSPSPKGRGAGSPPSLNPPLSFNSAILLALLCLGGLVCWSRVSAASFQLEHLRRHSCSACCRRSLYHRRSISPNSTRCVSSRHDTLPSACILTQEKVATSCVALVGQHDATRSLRQARETVRVVSLLVVT